jgi:hypothetical protein
MHFPTISAGRVSDENIHINRHKTESTPPSTE